MTNKITELEFEIPYKIEIEQSEDEDNYIHFYCISGKLITFYHNQDCCESVYIEDIVGNIQHLIGTPILRADEKVSNPPETEYESVTYTFYTFATKNGYVDVRWIGESNGYYSERVDMVVIEHEVPKEFINKYSALYPEAFI